MARTTTKIEGNSVIVSTEYFVAGQTDKEDAEDYMHLIQAMQRCTNGSCSGCVYGNLGDGCFTHIMRMAWMQLSKLCDEKYGKLDDE